MAYCDRLRFVTGLVAVAAVSLLVTACASKNQAPQAEAAEATKPAATDEKPGAVTTPWKPRPLTDRKFERTPARLARGRYLVEHVCLCFDCHSDIDWKKP